MGISSVATAVAPRPWRSGQSKMTYFYVLSLVRFKPNINGVWGYVRAKDCEIIQNRDMVYFLGVHRFAPIAGMISQGDHQK